ncbi:MDR family MFS transporter [Kribbia dieselivorans]|uniref:MDR family MFS transporter n=1 Tax=Kribbia dieselivorans TaxID=331526 RepID=UPI000A85CA09|nr:MDR family MFS transporter [Kribbia dieselivorans]
MSTLETQTKLRLVFSGLLVAMLLSSLDQTIFSTALPTVVGELDGVDQMMWVHTAYILAATVTMPVYGKFGDLLGRKWLFIGALGLFIAGSVVGGLAQDMTWLIIARTIQGLGGGGLMLLSQAIVADVVPERERGKYMGVIGAVFGLSAIAGPLLGGWFTEGIGWRWAFWINIPLGLLAVAAAWAFLPKGTRHASFRPDIAGIVSMAVSVTSVILVTSWGGNTYDWTSGTILGLIALAVVAAIVFVRVELRAEHPIIPMHLFADRNFTLSTAVGLITAIAMFGTIGYLPTYLQMVEGLGATQAGLMLIPMIAGMMITSLSTGQLVSKYGRYKWMPIASGVVMAVGLFLLSTITPETSLWVLSAWLFILGAGMGLGMQILVLVVQNAFPGKEVGTATGANSFFREVGASIGAAAVGSLFTARLTSELTSRLPNTGQGGMDTNALTPELVGQLPSAIHDAVITAYSEALTPVFAYLVPVILVGVVMAWFIQERPLAVELPGGNVPPDATEPVLADERLG